MTDERNWGAEEWRQPTIQDDDTVIFSECGRITHNTDFRSHWFKVVKQKCRAVLHQGRVTRHSQRRSSRDDPERGTSE